MCAARKHTGKVGMRTVKKSPARKSNEHSSPSPKTKKEPSSPLTDNGDTTGTDSNTSPSKDQGTSKSISEPPQNDKESEVEATSVQGGETAMDTQIQADSTSRDDDQGPSNTKGEETATDKSSLEEKSGQDTKKSKPKIHPFFGRDCILLFVCAPIN